MTYSGPTRYGPTVCLHDAPIDAICVDCARETLQQAADASNEALIVSLETLAEMDQPARVEIDDGWLVVVVTKCEHDEAFHDARYHYYLLSFEGDRSLVGFALDCARARAATRA